MNFANILVEGPRKNTSKLDPEGGHMFIEEFIPLFCDPEGGRM